MTTLGSLVVPAGRANGKTSAMPLDIPGAAASLAMAITAAGHSVGLLGDLSAIIASVTAWTQQDDDAHEPCSLTACRHPLHPGPCKGWKGTLHAVSPGTYKQIEEARVEKANARRVKRIADLRAQGKPIPRRLLTEIKPKPAPAAHPANGAQAVPLGQVNQKADLAGGQAHAAGQAVSKAAGVQVKTAPPLPLGPKAKKPTVAGRGPAFVITQPKVTDTYKLDKADKITPAEWAGLSDVDKTTIRNELTAIKARGFGPQQTKADALLAKLPAPNVSAAPGGKAPGAHPVPVPGKVTLGKAVKAAAPSGPASTPTPQLPAPAASPLKGTRDQNGILNRPLPGGSVTSTTVGLPSGYRITRDGMGYSLKHNGKLIRTSSTQAALEKYAHEHAKGASGTPSAPTPAAPAAPSGPTPQAPGPPSNTPQAFAPHVQHARAVAGRALGGRPTAKVHIDTYGKLTKGEFDSLDAATQKTIRDDLANAKAKFLDPKKQQAAQDILDRFGSRHPAPAAGPAGTTAMTPTNVAALIRKDGSADLMLGGKKVTVGFAGGSHEGKLEMVPGGHYVVTTKDGTKHSLAKGQLVTVAPKSGTTTPPTPVHPKGYSDPQNEVVKAATSGLVDTDKILQTVARLSPASVSKLDDGDRKAVLGRLAFVATHPKASDEQKAKATAYGRIINGGTRVPASQKWDHTPSIGELHTEEQKGGHAVTFDALIAAQDKTLDHAARVKALSALTKAQFDALPAAEQRAITDALGELHTAKKDAYGSTSLDKDAGLAFERLTGQHPGLHRLRQAETDFRAGKIDAEGVHRAVLRARVQSPAMSIGPTARGALEKEEQRVAEDNPKLPYWLRAIMIDNPYGGRVGTYSSIAQASNRYNWVDAPRLSSNDLSDIFRATTDELAASHPIHAQAVKELRENVLRTGLKGQPGVPSGSPWSLATRNAAVDYLLHINPGSGNDEIPAERLKEFKALPADLQITVERVLRDRVTAQTNDHAKTATWLQANQLGGRQSVDLTPDQLAAAKLAADRFARPDLDVFRKLDPSAEFDPLPSFVRGAIDRHLIDGQDRAERAGPVLTWTAQDNPLKVFPGALKDHLNGMRTNYTDRRLRNASDIANFGTKIINPYDRTRVYEEVPIGLFRTMPLGDQHLINDDLDKIKNNSGIPLPVRYKALVTKDIILSTPAHLNTPQVVAIKRVNPASASSDTDVVDALGFLDKTDYDKLDPVYRDAIDLRIASLAGSQQQAMNAKYHPAAPAAPAATPGGFTPTAQANVPPHVQTALDTIYGVHPKSHTMAHQLSTYGALRGSDFGALNGQEQGHLLGDLSFIATTAKGPSADKAKKLIDRFTPPGTPSGQVPTGAAIPPVNAVAGQVRYATPLKGLAKAKDSGTSGDRWISLPGGGRVWGAHGAAGLMLQHNDPNTGETRYLMVQRGPAISDPGKWTFPGGASDSKETPHQGATRETIEELGLKDDVFKDALVHGDHTFTVPGSTWKYTTVAASVPTMIKPDLSTAHARAETSDAKWLTLAEIQALDKSGSLHHPIAGGKLEQNVLSLYPAPGTKLGQVARPGPVTKRLGRLNLPSGGRQAPATFNAWPHAHKQSKGKDLIGDKTALDAQRQKIKQDRKLYDGKTADGRLAAIGAQQGFDDTPTVLDKKEIDRLLATGDYIEVFRGVRGAGGGYSARGRGSHGGKTAADINEEMRSGPAYYGTGIFGNGYYLATQRRVATQYADGSSGSIARMLIPKSAVTKKYDAVKQEAFKNPRTSQAKGGSSYESSTFYDPGRYAAAKGIDGIEINPHHMSPGGGAGHVASHGKPAFNWLNRSVLIMQKEPG
jgi:8-oxo-dGTP pyrophosphatase MutT (NUDIX family)